MQSFKIASSILIFGEENNEHFCLKLYGNDIYTAIITPTHDSRIFSGKLDFWLKSESAKQKLGPRERLNFNDFKKKDVLLVLLKAIFSHYTFKFLEKCRIGPP